jgi:hypothetical protein
MAITRPSGLSIVDPASVVVAQEATEIDARGRLHILPRWTERIAWWRDEEAFEVLMVLDQPGAIMLRDWKTDGQRVLDRYQEIRKRDDEQTLEALRLFIDRYQRLRFDKERRAHIGDAALAHLGLPIGRGTRFTIYLAIFPQHLALLSPSYRDARLIRGSPLLDDLP